MQGAFRSYNSGSTQSVSGSIMNDAIIMPIQHPAKLAIPFGGDVCRYEFSLRGGDTVEQFTTRVIENAPGVNHFKIRAEDQSTTINALKRSIFEIEVNKNVYKVYPDIGSVINYNVDSQTENTKELIQLNELNNSMKFSRAVSITEFCDKLLTINKKSEKMTKSDILNNFETAIKDQA